MTDKGKTNGKFITNLRLYFTSWFFEQHYSLSNFIHINTKLNFNNLCQTSTSHKAQYLTILSKIIPQPGWRNVPHWSPPLWQPCHVSL